MFVRAFVDSSICLYALIKTQDGSKYQTASTLILNQRRPIISSQVINEVCSNLIKKTSILEERLRELIADWYLDCYAVYPNTAQHLLASRLRCAYSLSYWDSLVVAAAIDTGYTILYS